MSVVKQRLCAKEAATYLGLSASTLAKKRMTGDGPPYFKLGRKVLYDTKILDGWLDSRICTSTSESS